MSKKIDAGRVAVLAAMALLTATGEGTLVAAAQAEECPPNEQIRREQPYAVKLPDCRAYEQVSPVNKSITDAVGEPGVVQSSRSGDMVTFFSLVPFPGIPGAGELPTYLSTREGSGEWITQGLLPQANPGPEPGDGIVEDLTRDDHSRGEPILAPGAVQVSSIVMCAATSPVPTSCLPPSGELNLPTLRPTILGLFSRTSLLTNQCRNSRRIQSSFPL